MSYRRCEQRNCKNLLSEDAPSNRRFCYSLKCKRIREREQAKIRRERRASS